MAGFIIMELVKGFVPMIVPSFLSLYFDFFDGVIQAVVFSLLTVMYVNEGIEKAES
jgi:F-type H+-transporting ATPase subunit a